MMVGKNSEPQESVKGSQVPSIAWIEVCTLAGKATASGCGTGSVNTGLEIGVCWNGGLLVALPNRFPKTRSWKIPNAPRTEVFPSWNGSQANPSLGSKLLKLLSYRR